MWHTSNGNNGQRVARIIVVALAACCCCCCGLMHATSAATATAELISAATTTAAIADTRVHTLGATSATTTVTTYNASEMTASASANQATEVSFLQYCWARRNSFAALFTFVLYSLVCLVGLFGNTLVIYVVLRFSKMQTVTNIYILNLAIADECFLIGIPFLLYTMRICSWKFGEYMCKAYMVSTSITQFTSSIFLLIMSADRYLAVCHPISSPKYRTIRIAKLVSAFAWLTSAVLMLPVILYASTVAQEDDVNLSCNIDWPELYKQHSASTFILYTFLLGFALPLCFILFFYCLVIRKLQAVGAKHKSKEKRRSHRKVTRLVLTVITVYVLCWLPHWISQVALISSTPELQQRNKDEQIIVFLLLGCLSYSNSAMNPILYAFLSDNFRKSFSKAFSCMARQEVNAQLQLEPSVLTKQGSRKRTGSKRLICGGQATVTPKQALQPNSGGVGGICVVGNNNSSATTSSTTTTAPEHVNATLGSNTTTSSSGSAPPPPQPPSNANGRVLALAEDTILMLDAEEQTVAMVVLERPQSHLLQTDL